MKIGSGSQRICKPQRTRPELLVNCDCPVKLFLRLLMSAHTSQQPPKSDERKGKLRGLRSIRNLYQALSRQMVLDGELCSVLRLSQKPDKYMRQPFEPPVRHSGLFDQAQRPSNARVGACD